jgi:hypothetical protein
MLEMLICTKCWKVDNYEECRFVIICSKYPKRCWWFSSHFEVESWNLRKFLVQFFQFYDLVFKLKCSSLIDLVKQYLLEKSFKSFFYSVTSSRCKKRAIWRQVKLRRSFFCFLFCYYSFFYFLFFSLFLPF